MGQEQNHSHENGKNEGMVFFTGTWDEALAQAKKENKLIFLDIYASWCAPCKMLKNNFGQAGLDYLNTMSKKVTETQPD
ncbi:MAG: thioredoxin family protein [Bacteroidales bacterium]|nr:thioredoxin family protein [Bacteroidales bacterium]